MSGLAAMAVFLVTGGASGQSEVGEPPAETAQPAGTDLPFAGARTAEEAWAEGRRLADRGQIEKALAVIEDALLHHPDNTSLLWLKAGVTGWGGRHEESVEQFEDLVTRHPEMADEVRLDLATQRLWSGDAAAALRDLDLHLARHPADPEARRLRHQALAQSGPGMTATYERSDDNDGQRVLSSIVEYRHPLGRRDALFLLMRQDESSDPAGVREAFRMGAGYERTWSERWSAGLALLHLNPGPGRPKAAVGEAALAYQPSRRVRIDLGVEREPVLTRQALELDILIWTAVAGVDWQPHSRLALHFARRQHDYSDDNESFRHTFAANIPLLQRDRVRLTTGFQIEQLNSARELDHGYYSPDRYLEYGPGVELEWEPAEPWMFGLALRTGRQVENDEDHDLFSSVTASAQAPLGSLFALGLEGYHSDSSLRSVSGFEGSGWSIFVATRF